MRNKVLDVAEQAFQSQGYHATSLGDLMKAAGVSGGALHHHFPTKKAIGLAVIGERIAQAVRQTWIVPIHEARSAREGVRTVFTTVAAELEAQKFVRGCPLNNLAHELSLADPDFRIAFNIIFGQWQAAIEQAFVADQQAGREPASNVASDFALKAVALYSGAMSMAKTAQDPAPLRICGAAFEADVAFAL
ncbi:TetR family transcriptional regulator [Mesorhizobium sp. NBSH29]|nr:TetR family transcriptional regulator [Mesorhizobium sp. NBSH29]